MKTIRYSFFETKPKNTDDCIDYFNRIKTEFIPVVSLDLFITERATETNILSSFMGEYTWQFGDLKTSYRKLYGGFFDNATIEQRRKSRTEALKRVRKDLERLTDSGIVPNNLNVSWVIS